MTLRRKMALQIAATLLGLLLVSGASLWGINALHQDFGSAIAGYRDLRHVYEITSHVATARTLLTLETPDLAGAVREIRLAAGKLELFVPSAPAATQAKPHLQRGLAEAQARLEEAIAHQPDPRSPSAATEPLNRILLQASSLATQIRTAIEQKQQAADSSRRTAMLLMSALAGLTVLGAIALGISQYRSVMRPLTQLGIGVRRIAGGRFNERLELTGHTEHRALADDFNHMAGQLDELYRELEQKVAHKSRELARSQRLASVGFLAAGVAHEINNPLGIIAGNAEFSLQQLRRLRPEDAMAEAEKTLGLIGEEAFRCKAIVEKLLTLARPGEEDRRPVSLGSVARSVVESLAGLKDYSGRRVTLDVADADLCILASEGEMKQVILNLLINALEAEAQRIAVTVKRKNATVELSVEDDGRGMSGEVLERVFEPFFTAKRGAGKPGTGLGLSIAHAIVESHGGNLAAQSDGPGRGSRFVLQIPHATAQRRPTEQEVAS